MKEMGNTEKTEKIGRDVCMNEEYEEDGGEMSSTK